MTTPRKRKNRRIPEYFFLPPLKMVLTSTEDEASRDSENTRKTGGSKGLDPRTVARLIEKLRKKDE